MRDLVIHKGIPIQENENFKKMMEHLQECNGYFVITKRSNDWDIHFQGLWDEEIVYRLELYKHRIMDGEYD